MKTVFLFLFINSSLTLSCVEQEEIYGKWVLNEVDSTMIYECPDVIEIKRDSTYVLFNDCYGSNMQNPILEEGKWVIDDSSIFLYQRNYKSDQYFQQTKGELTLEVVELKEKNLTLLFNNGSNSRVEKYVRLLDKE